MKIKKIKREKTEAEIQREICDFLAKKNVFFWRNNSTGLFDPFKGRFRKKGKYEILGVSDILAVIYGRFIAIEVKSKNGKASEYQLKFIENVIKNGGFSFIARSIEDVEKNLFLLI
ncbi:MAG: VRR-NUC domain-containing protein [Acidobacteria bacterium]|jgi:hypothetical protein|nr:VRR-NUC domain-containing protein [Acidobacteriota bacterium]